MFCPPEDGHPSQLWRRPGNEPSTIESQVRRANDWTTRPAIRVVGVCRCVQCDFEVRIVRDLTVQSLKLVSDAVRQHPDVGPAAHLYFSQVIHRSSAVFTRSLHQQSCLTLSFISQCSHGQPSSPSTNVTIVCDFSTSFTARRHSSIWTRKTFSSGRSSLM